MLPFNESIDKITERELVFDIVERLKLGRDITNGSVVQLNAGTYLTDVISKLISMMSPEVTLDYNNMKCAYIKISAGHKSGSIMINGLNEQKVVLACSKQTGADITECINVEPNGEDGIICTMTSDAPYYNDEYIKIYAI